MAYETTGESAGSVSGAGEGDGGGVPLLALVLSGALRMRHEGEDLTEPRREPD